MLEEKGNVRLKKSDENTARNVKKGTKFNKWCDKKFYYKGIQAETLER